jgi:hypothetical protein
MISPFLKKLLFARQFSMIDGKIEILGKSQVLLPEDVVYELEKIDSKLVYSSVKNAIKGDITDYARRLGSTGEGMLKVLDDIFETFGLGDLEIIDINYKMKKCVLRVNHPPSLELKEKKGGFSITPAVLSGMFSFLFSKDVDAKQSKMPTSAGYFEYVIG